VDDVNSSKQWTDYADQLLADVDSHLNFLDGGAAWWCRLGAQPFSHAVQPHGETTSFPGMANALPRHAAPRSATLCSTPTNILLLPRSSGYKEELTALAHNPPKSLREEFSPLR